MAAPAVAVACMSTPATALAACVGRGYFGLGYFWHSAGGAVAAILSASVTAEPGRYNWRLSATPRIT